jgi:hypothetical protein
MSDTYDTTTQTSLVAMNTKKLIYVIIAGVVAGIVTWGLTALLETYVYKAILCGHTTAGQCASSYQYALTTATIIGAAVGLLGLVRLHVFRPLLVIIASFISLWGILTMLQPAAWYVALLVTAGLYGFAFGLFAWLARIRTFYIAAIIIIAMVVVLRLILNS